MRNVWKSLAIAAVLLAGWGQALAQEVVLHTDRGAIRLKLYTEQAPVTVANFLEYARSGFYDGTIFHRVIPQFMIQTGGFDAEMREKPTRDPIANESRDNRLNNDRWTVAMARASDPDSATSQFYINLRMNPELDHLGDRAGYAVFGEVIDGQHVAREISLLATHALGGHQNVPVEPVVIERVEIVE